jgi:hypothetical protein
MDAKKKKFGAKLKSEKLDRQRWMNTVHGTP